MPSIEMLKMLGSAIAMLVVVAVIYHAGGAAPRAEYTALVQHNSEVVANQQAQKRDLKTRLETKYDTDMLAVNTGWAAYVRGVQAQPPDPALGKFQPKICDDRGGNDRLLATIQGVERATQAEDDRHLAEVGALLERASGQGVRLAACRDWAVGVQTIESPR